ncbi:MAG TPA: bifunctional serine/threonine-protein kinase/universal stress protein [Thermoanaerobaculia bacterium]|nr:bifunctional serine/threonine-protein kinase/universal stress protein [Thermoanaerobaculia bacterium]
MIKAGDVVDGFLVGKRIHSGAMGDIFALDGNLIMKVPRAAPSESIIAFETEATIVPALRGPHVPRFVAAGDLARTPYLVTEWIDGVNVEDVLQGGALPPDEVARVGAAVADALHSIHEQETIHHDLKPENIILKKDGVAALIDFGFAHHARYPDLLAEETRFGAGSAAYVSPEQIRGVRDDPRSDLFALGVVMYEMATGRLPFGEPDTDVRNRLWLDPAPPIANVPWLQEIILRCLEVDVAQRYQSAAHIAFDLRNPEQVVLTARAKKAKQATFTQQLRRFFNAWREHADRPRRLAAPAHRAPIVMVAVDTEHLDDARQPAIRRATAQVLSLSTEFRLICVTVFPPGTDHLDHLVRLRHWVEPLRMSAQRISLHAIESDDAAEALLEFAGRNHVDLIVLGAPGPAQPDRTWWRSVASIVTASAACSVHVVRVGRGTAAN